MLLYRVFPYVGTAKAGQAGHPLYLHPDQGAGRWDNRSAYLAMYVASQPEGAIGETFAHLATWRASMLQFPAVPGAVRSLGVYEVDEEALPLLELDDPKTLVARAIRPSEVVIRNRPHTQALALAVFNEHKWSGISWWSMHRPQWQLHVLFGASMVTVRDVQPLAKNPHLFAAAGRLAKVVRDDLR